jgi:hypothetical protein
LPGFRLLKQVKDKGCAKVLAPTRTYDEASSQYKQQVWSRSQVSDLVLPQEAARGKPIARPIRAAVIRVLSNTTAFAQGSSVESTIIVSLDSNDAETKSDRRE